MLRFDRNTATGLKSRGKNQEVKKTPRLPLTDSRQKEEKNRTHSLGLKRENKIHRLDMEARSKFKMAVLESDARKPGNCLE